MTGLTQRQRQAFSVPNALERSAPVQRKLHLDDAPALVLATVTQARYCLSGYDEDNILDLIDNGFLAFTWDISIKPGKTAREFRIFPPCIAHCKKSPNEEFPLSFDAVVAQLLARHNDKPFLMGTTVKLLLNCGATHLINLVDSGALRCLPNNPAIQKSKNPILYRRGPNGSPCITRDSFISFLRERLEGGL